MKRLLSLLLAVLLIASVSTTAFAASETNTGTNSTSIPVMGIYNEPNTDVISVDISWGAMEFTYTPEAWIWKPDKHLYEGYVDDSWEANGNTITIANHSNIDVSVTVIPYFDAFTMGYAIECSHGNISVLNAQTPLHLSAAENGSEQSNAPSLTVTVNVLTMFEEDIQFEDGDTLGTIGITISKYTEN